MRVYISVDMEGIAGTFSWAQDQGEWRPQVRRLMTLEVNAAVEGALEAGASRIVVNDSHDRMSNLDPELLHPVAELIQGSPKPLSMVQGIEEGFDAALFLGYHGGAGTAGATLDHTYSGTVEWDVRINGRAVNEAALNAGVCGYFGVPVVLVSGDDAACRQMAEWMPWVRTVVVKHAVGRTAARSVHPERARAMLKEASRDALRDLEKVAPGAVPLLRFEPPVVVELTTVHTGQADAACIMPGVERTGPRTLRYTASDYLTAFSALRSMLIMARSGD
ncbi:MAG: M55 family metallopeptidase [Limnochordaceae bacterium]|nr:M55 family metallopeptidase [Limnochordaceae bacterium]